MSTTLSQPAICPNCGKPLPASAPAGLCPACLLAQGMDTDPGGKPGRFQQPPVEEIARLFPKLEILGLLGAGGMGAVYKARQPALDRFVALKVLPPQDKAGADSAERFNREARALARLSHPNIVAVHEFGFARAGGLQPPPTARAGDFQSPPAVSPANAPDGDFKSPARSQPETPNSKPETPAPAFPYFIMEFVDGANLRQLGRAARLSPREALQIIPQICDALQYAHDEGVVHRDIKPENVLVDRRGRVKIADFGLAKIFGPDGDALRLTAEGQVMGTPHYMAPEQVERPLTVDHRADIYSLGVVFYELLTGDLPLGKFAPPSRKVSVDVRLDDVVLRALENDPARRYQQVSEVKSQVETISSQPNIAQRGEVPTPPPIPPPGTGLSKETAGRLPMLSPFRRATGWAVFLTGLAGFALLIGLAMMIGGAVVSEALRTRPVMTGAQLAGVLGLVLWFSWRRARASVEETKGADNTKSILRIAWTNFLLGTVMVWLHLAPRLLGRTPQALEAQITATGLSLLGWIGLGMLSFGVLWLMRKRTGTQGFLRSLAAMSLGLFVTAHGIFITQGNAWHTDSQPRLMEWQLAWLEALGVLAGWWALAAMRGQVVGIGWRVLAAVGALAAVVMPMLAATWVGAGLLMRWFPAVRDWAQWGESAGFRLTLLSAAIVAVAGVGQRAWSWSQGKRELPGHRLGLALACLVVAWVVSQHHSRVQAYASGTRRAAELQPGDVRLFQTHTTPIGSQGMSFAGRVTGLRPGWRLNAGWVVLDGSGAGTAQAGTRTTNNFHYMFTFPTSFALRRPQQVSNPQPWTVPSRQWDLSPGKRETVIAVTNSAGQSLACFVELLPDTALTPLGNSAVAVQRGVERQPDGQPIPRSAGVSLTVAPRHVAAVGVFLRERNRLTSLPELSAMLVAPAGERVSREISWEAMVTENRATNVPPQVRVHVGVAGELSRRAKAVLPDALAGCRLVPVGFGQGVLLAAGELREWVLFDCVPVARGGPATKGELVVRLVSQPLAADWQPDLLQPQFQRGTNWALLIQPDPSRQNQFAKTIPANVPSPRAPRGELTLQWHDVSVHPNSELIAQGPVAVSGGEMVLGRLRWPTGRIEESEASARNHNTGFPISSALGVHFAFPTNFPLALKQQAAAQLKSISNSNQPLTLLAGQWRPVFSITNAAGESVTGEMTFSPGVPSTKMGEVELHFPANHPMQGLTSGSQLTLALRSDVPLGCRLLATAESPSSLRVSATVNRIYRSGKITEHVIWFLNRPQPREVMANAGAQVRAFATRDSLRLKLGERKEVFRFTNDRGETFAGALELIAVQ
ncbi:MAG: serine/threonine protein kinase bacterial [Limisphaerales bacterium]|nr:MAG: serine/threonine protein kinase bacterial [Limisphaerales bacterium]KAG0507812.1 MAG: serine/threonine protein kinase bacterial [Limisphaerales bacterium]TXT48815.1 MAG: serine/threonine protein kinase bacterial [Limisphaerales bacterium]